MVLQELEEKRDFCSGDSIEVADKPAIEKQLDLNVAFRTSPEDDGFLKSWVDFIRALSSKRRRLFGEIGRDDIVSVLVGNVSR